MRGWVGVDADPVLLALGRSVAGNAVRLVEALIGAPGWQAAVVGEGRVDAVVSSAVLRYPPPDALASIYRQLGDVVRPGGELVNADEFVEGQAAVRALGEAFAARRSTMRG